MFKKYHSSQSAASLSIYQNCFLKKYIFKIACSKNILSNSFSKLLPQKIHSRNCSLKKILFWNFSLKKHLKIAPCKNAFSKHLFKISFSKNTFSKSLPQKLHFQNGSLKKTYIVKIASSKNMFLKKLQLKHRVLYQLLRMLLILLLY